MGDEEIYLINEDGKKRNCIYGTVESAGQKEFFAADQNGFKAEKRITVYSEEYDNEPLAEINGKRYAIYRTFARKDHKTELYLTSRIGV